MTTTLTTQQDQICAMAADGRSGRDICRTLGMSNYALATMLDDMPAFSSRYERARKVGAQGIVDEMDEVRDPEKWPDLQRAKLWCEQQRWRLSRQFRAEFGDRVDVGVEVTVNLAEALQAAKARALRPERDPAPAIEGECVDVSTPAPVGRIDSVSIPGALPAPIDGGLGVEKVPPAPAAVEIPDIFS